MFEAARKFALRVILIHLALLLVVITVLTLGVRSLYLKAREQQIASVAEKQQLLASQTARGIEAYYRSIILNLELILRPEANPASQPATIPSTMPGETADGPNGQPIFGTAPPPGRGPPGGDHGGPGGPPGPQTGSPGGRNPNRNGQGNGRERMTFLPAGSEQRIFTASPLLLDFMWQQLHTRASYLFIVERDDSAGAHPTAKVSFCYPKSELAVTTGIAERNLQWITGLTDTEVSDFITLDNGTRVHLIGVPARRMEPSGGKIQFVPCTVVAVVPISYIKEDFFDRLNNERLTNAALLDSQGTIMITMEPKLIGLNVLDLDAKDPSLVDRFIRQGQNGTAVVPISTQFHGVSLPPRIMAFEQVKTDFDNSPVAASRPASKGTRWIVMIGSPLADSEALVNGVFKSALYWAIFVALSVTGLFFSSSYFLIRARVRFERQKGDMLTRELNQARDIQLAWLPKPGTHPSGIDVAAVNLPASHISGDFYNWFTLPDNKIAVAIGDVTGHGMSAAFLMSTTQLLVRTTLLRVKDVGKCLEEVNRQLCSQSFSGQFVTMLLMVLDPEHSTIEVAAAGHPAPMIANHSAFRPLEIETQLVMGVEPATPYATQSYVLHPGTTLLLYTDGVVEAEAADGSMYLTKRLLASVSKDFPSAQAIVDAVVADVRAFCNGNDLLDDLTLVALQLLPVSASVNQPDAIATKL